MAVEVSKASAQELSIQEALDKKAARKQLVSRIVPYVGLAFVLVFFSVVTGGRFISPANLTNMVNQCFSLVIVAVGASFVYAHGGMDFSIGASCGVAQMVGGLVLTKLGLPMPVVILATLIVPVLGCLLVALISAVFHVPVFIGSMCERSVFMGILTVGVSRSEIAISIAKYGYMNNVVLKVIVLAVVIAAGTYVFEFTALGKREKAIGGNMATARQAGIRINKQIFWAYALMGLCVGVAAVFSMFRSGTVSINSGSGMEFNIMLAVVLGGFPMSGGDKASVGSAIVGALTAILLTNGLTVWGLDPNLVNGVKGLLFVAIIGLSYDRSLGKLVT